jgi:hypothetical protein
MATADQAWLDGLKVGDEVVVEHGSYYANPELTKVLRRTPSGRIITAGAEFNPNGWARQQDVYGRRSRLRQPTPQLREKVERLSLVGTLSSVKWDQQPLEVLRAVAAACGLRKEPAAALP